MNRTSEIMKNSIRRRVAGAILAMAGLLIPSVAVAADYVIASKISGTVYYLARSGTSGVERVTMFNPATCVWSCASNTAGTTAGTLSNSNTYGYLYQMVNGTRYFLKANSLGIATSASSSNRSTTRWRTNGTYLYNYYSSSYSYYINLYNATPSSITTNNAYSAQPYLISDVAASTTLGTPVLSETSVTLGYGESQAFTATATASTVPAHRRFTIDGTTYYLYNDALYTSTDNFANTPAVTYNWAVSGSGSSYVSLDATTGATVTATVSTINVAATSATLTVTASTAGASNRTASATITIPVSISQPAISFNNSTNTVTITCATDGTTIYYTLDGSDPTSGSTAYSAPFSCTEPATIKAVAYKDGGHSPVATFELAKLPKPLINTHGVTNNVTLEGSGEGVAYRYTVGTTSVPPADPTATTGTLWDGSAMTTHGGKVMKAIAVKDGYISSDVATRVINTDDLGPKTVVFMYNDGETVHFLGSNGGIVFDATTFNPDFCLWTGDLFHHPDHAYDPYIVLKNGGHNLYLYDDRFQFQEDVSTRSDFENELLFQTISHPTYGDLTFLYYEGPYRYDFLRYNNGWKVVPNNALTTTPSLGFVTAHTAKAFDAVAFNLNVAYPAGYFESLPRLSKGETLSVSASVEGGFRPEYYEIGYNNSASSFTYLHYYYYPNTSVPMNAEPALADSIHISYELIGGAAYCELVGNTVSMLTDPGRDVLATVRVTATPYFGDEPYTAAAQVKEYQFYLLTQPPFPSPIISRVEGTNDYRMTCSAAAAVIEYRIDGAAPCASYGDAENNPPHPGWCLYDGPVTVNVPGTVISARSYRDTLMSDTVQYRVGAAMLLPPAITLDPVTGTVALDKDASNSTLPGYVAASEKILYTINGSDPDPDLYGAANPTQEYDPLNPPVLGNGLSIRVMSIHAGLTHSVVVASTYKKASGLDASGWGVVTLNDYEDHNWSYYQPDENLPAGYPSSLHSPYPRNVKITYYGYGDSTLSTSAVANPAANTFINSTTETDVKVGIGEEGHTFVYYKTLERDGNNRFPYELIANPFSVRPDVRSYAGTQTLRFDLHDNGGNGWNSQLLIDFSDGTATKTVRLHSGSDSTFSITINRGVTVRLTWSAGGGANSECSFTVAYSGGSQIYASGDGPRSGVLKSFKVEGASYTVSTYTGFHRWRLKSVKNGAVYTSSTGSSAKAKGDTLGAEVTYWFQPTDNALTNAGNATSMEVELEALWAPAEVNNGGTSFSRGYNSVERNFSVRRSGTGTDVLSGSTPCTFSSFYPNGTTNGTTEAALGNRLTIRGGGTAGAACKVEYYLFSGTNTINGNGNNLTIGRGVEPSGSSYCSLQGHTNSNSTVSSNLNYRIRVESGTYANFYLIAKYESSRTYSGTVYAKAILGSDYDRAMNDNTKLSVAPAGEVFGCKYIQFDSENNKDKLMFDWNVKSGQMQRTLLGDARAEYSFYMGGSTSPRYQGMRRLVIEGGELASIAGGINGYYSQNDERYSTYSTITIPDNAYIRITNGKAVVRGSIYGAAAFAGAAGGRTYVFTGGEIRGWVAGGANGTALTGGTLYGATYMYIGGNTSVNSNSSSTVINRAVGGNVFGAGCGYSASSSSGEVTLGSNVVLADSAYVERGVYGGGSYGYTEATSNIYILGGTVEGRSGGVNGTSYSSSITGGVYGGACQNDGGTVNITMTGGLVKTGIYGGSNADGDISGDVTMHIDGGQLGTDAEHPATGVFGGGYGSDTRVLGSVDLTLGTAAGAATYATIYGDVYGGSAQGRTNGDDSRQAGSETNVTLNAGKIHGSLYGGGLGTNSNPAYVYGPVQVKVYGGGVHSTTVNGSGAVYGCNNVNGAPRSTVKVDIYDTDDPADGQRYALDAVYGGGNAANYTGNLEVTIHGCNNSIEYVYGGGNAAAINGNTTVTIYGADSIGWVFGGGHGDRYAEPPYQADINGDVTVNIYGGTVNKVFGGSNSKGPISGSITVNVNRQAEDGSAQCPVKIGELYGGGNEARSHAGTIHIGCTGSGPGEGIRNLFGGANKADVDGSIVLNIGGGVMRNVFGGNNNGGTIDGSVAVNITGGTIDTLFGGNNAGGNITGTIAVTVDYAAEHSCPAPYKLDVVFGGGKNAAYSPSAATRSSNLTPSVVLVNDTITHYVFGGGKGELARVLGSPLVQLGRTSGSGQVKVHGDVYGGGDAAPVGQPHVAAVAADPDAEPPVAAQAEVDELLASPKVLMNKGVVNGSIFGGGLGSTAVITGSTVVDIRGLSTVKGNVYGGGNAGEVSGNTDVRIGDTD